MLIAKPNEELSVQMQLLNDISSLMKKKVSHITVRSGKVINRSITGGIFILSGHALLYKVEPATNKRVFLDRLTPGRLFFQDIINLQDDGELELVAEEEVKIAVANLRQLQQTNRVLAEKISNALFQELGITCSAALYQVCTLRKGSAKERLVSRAQQVAQFSDLIADGDWQNLGVSTDLFLDMSGVSSRQFSRLLPELESEQIIKVSEGLLMVKCENLNVQEIG